ncbi:FkbM family methyltransferase [Brucella intermedia]|uniref:FkbM family methyltransferase n=1 Tax=Brucella intermedia TaxID=94625 RepID=UPI00224A7514|nr:FkbM family methyltransferase [Brucella intermedia]
MQVLQVGACDGRRFDPLFGFLSSHKGVSGVFVEPIIEYFDLLVENYQHIPGARFFNVAISDYNGVSTIRLVDPDAILNKTVPEWAVGISTLERNRNAIDGVLISEENFQKIQEKTIERSVPVVEVNKFVRESHCEDYNVYLSDCEGHDYTILSAMDLDKFHPEIIFAESMLMSDEELYNIRSKLTSCGYEFENDDVDLIAYTDAVSPS